MSNRIALAALLTLALAGPVAADESYWLDAKGTQANGNRWYLMRFGTVIIGPGEVERVWLNLSTCPGGLDHIDFYYIEPLERDGEYGYQPSWGYPVRYNGYPHAASVIIGNYSAGPMTFRVKLNVRCDE